MIDFLRALILGPRNVATRLTVAEVISLVEPLLEREELTDLGVPQPRLIANRTIWFAASDAKDANWWIEIDDATGEVGPLRRGPSL